jgi:hypothetical protein
MLSQRKISCAVDLDGVLADLFNHVSHTFFKKRYRDVTTKEKAVSRKMWTDKEMFYKHMGDVKECFANLDPYPTNNALLKTVIDKFGGFYICTHPTDVDIDACIKGKSIWIKKHIIPHWGKYLLGVEFPHDKSELAVNEDGSPNVLIDDFQPYVDKWNAKGGIAIRLQSDNFRSDAEVENYLDGEFKRISKDIVDDNKTVRSQELPSETHVKNEFFQQY